MTNVKEIEKTTIQTSYFGSLTDRMNKYREDVLDKKPYIDAERAVLATRAYQEHKEKPNVLKRAYMLKEILENMTLYIEDETMIVGNQASSNKDAPIFPEYTLEFVLNELDLFEKRDGDVFYITEETKEQLLSGKTITSVRELELYFQKKFRFIWKLASLAWKER